MTRFMLTGHRGNALINLAWDDGRLYGDPEAVEIIKRMAAALEGAYTACPGCPGSTHHHLHNPWTAYSFMRTVVRDKPGDRPTLKGSLPKLDPPPKGDILKTE